MAHLSLSGTYADADTRLGKRDSLVIGHNTRAVRRARDIAVVYYSTAIVALTPDGWAVVNVNGWDTVTTWSRVNDLLPAPFAIWANGKHGRYLYAAGAPILPYVDGLAVNGATGAVGMAGGPIGELFSAEDIGELRAAHMAMCEARGAKRAERIRLEHPTARPVTYREDMPHTRYGPYSPMTDPHRYHAWDCASCRAEQSEWSAIRAETLRADHPNGHAWAVDIMRPDAWGRPESVGQMAEPAGPCPWDCPERAERIIR